MTRDEIIAKWAGMTSREKDAWIERIVFGRETFGQFRETNGIRVLISHYSTDISAAWTVFERFPYVEVARIPGPVTTYGVRINDPDDGRIYAMTKEPTFPEAICLAALIAKLTEVSADVAV